MSQVGVLALQGCIMPHVEMLKRLGVDALLVRTPAELARVSRIILPGGESTTMLKLLHKAGLWEPLREFCETKPVWGVCAGSILLANDVVNPAQESLGVMQIRAHRNFYGSQRESFAEFVEVPVLDGRIEVQFIRAPKLEAMAPDVNILATRESQAILMRQGNKLASAFHVELGSDSRLHEYFLGLQ